MLVFTTLFPAAIVIIIVQVIATNLRLWIPIQYLLMLSIGAVFLVLGGVHFIYIGLEVMGLGSLAIKCLSSIGGERGAQS